MKKFILTFLLASIFATLLPFTVKADMTLGNPPYTVNNNTYDSAYVWDYIADNGNYYKYYFAKDPSYPGGYKDSVNGWIFRIVNGGYSRCVNESCEFQYSADGILSFQSNLNSLDTTRLHSSSRDIYSDNTFATKVYSGFAANGNTSAYTLPSSITKDGITYNNIFAAQANEAYGSKFGFLLYTDSATSQYYPLGTPKTAHVDGNGQISFEGVGQVYIGTGCNEDLSICDGQFSGLSPAYFNAMFFCRIGGCGSTGDFTEVPHVLNTTIWQQFWSTNKIVDAKGVIIYSPNPTPPQNTLPFTYNGLTFENMVIQVDTNGSEIRTLYIPASSTVGARHSTSGSNSDFIDTTPYYNTISGVGGVLDSDYFRNYFSWNQDDSSSHVNCFHDIKTTVNIYWYYSSTAGHTDACGNTHNDGDLIVAKNINVDGSVYPTPPIQPFLSLPLAGYTPYTAPVSSVFDHSGVAKYKTQSDGKIFSFTGEETVQGASPYPGDACYSNTDDVAFGTGFNYVGTSGTGGKYSLCYDGHPGIDYSVGVGTDVYSSAYGIVLSADRDDSCTGRAVVIQHGTDFITKYFHLDSIDSANVKVGEPINPCVIIGKSGNDGTCSSGAHLHFQLEKLIDGVWTPVDPYGWQSLVKTDPYRVKTDPLWIVKPPVTVGTNCTCTSIQEAYNYISTNDQSIQLKAETYTGDLDFGNNVNVLLQGGYDSSLITNSGLTIIFGSLTIRSGTVVADNICIQ